MLTRRRKALANAWANLVFNDLRAEWLTEAMRVGILKFEGELMAND
ncbi:hypothetical protein CASFOL_009281 [Castilleja foliolosa]|uniref:Uncharacterized protein n=1 Tax=Castilleja foliolosa TaxID=1961234 RepID=A0ABD3DXE5_9LAMI